MYYKEIFTFHLQQSTVLYQENQERLTKVTGSYVLH